MAEVGQFGKVVTGLEFPHGELYENTRVSIAEFRALSPFFRPWRLLPQAAKCLPLHLLNRFSVATVP